MPTIFAAPWDKQLRTLTFLICAVFLLLVLLMPWRPAVLPVIKAALVVMIAGIWAWAPVGYRVEDGYLIIRRKISDVRIPLEGLSRARRITRDDFSGAVRVWAVGGVFGYYGKFLVGVESQTWYVTDMEKCVCLDWPSGVVVVSPHDPEAFLSALSGYACPRPRQAISS